MSDFWHILANFLEDGLSHSIKSPHLFLAHIFAQEGGGTNMIRTVFNLVFSLIRIFKSFKSLESLEFSNSLMFSKSFYFFELRKSFI